MNDRYDKSMIPNYRKINTCANCKNVFDRGIDEEIFKCEKYDREVEHDYFCDSYITEG